MASSMTTTAPCPTCGLSCSCCRHRTTLGDTRPAAEVCRANGWGPGTRLAGDDGWGETVIEITAVGDKSVMARKVSQGGRPTPTPEGVWKLHLREREVAPA